MNLGTYERIVFFTGAGISAESGVPTYRGRGGIWTEYDYREYACQRAFERDPQKVLDFHELRRAKVLACAPHAGHRRIAELQAARSGITLITQNIDGLHARAGSVTPIELHGSLWRLRCARHGIVEDFAAGAYARRYCAHCDATLRPDITWFEDAIDTDAFERAGELVRTAQLFVAVGTSAVVWPAAGFIEMAREAGACMVEINPEETGASELFDLHVREPASIALPRLFPLDAG